MKTLAEKMDDLRHDIDGSGMTIDEYGKMMGINFEVYPEIPVTQKLDLILSAEETIKFS